MRHFLDIYRHHCFVHLLVIIALVIMPGFVFAQTSQSTKLTSVQTERISFETTTLTESQFLKGERTGDTATIWGDLRFPQLRRGRVPVVILLHGTVGVGPREERWAQELNKIGVATFVLDSFSGRGHAPPFESGSVPSPLTMIVDSYRALNLLAKHPRVDSKRIALMGFSRGGVATLYAGLRRFRRFHNPAGLQFAAYIPFYANCTFTYLEDEQMTDHPIRLHHGTADENMPIEACREYLKRLSRAGKDVQLTDYTGARHSFDDADLASISVQPKGLNWTRCRFSESAVGEIVNLETNKAFSLSNPCFSRGPTVGYSREAHAKALCEVKTFLATIFNLKTKCAK